jgi:hypothetical protein
MEYSSLREKPQYSRQDTDIQLQMTSKVHDGISVPRSRPTAYGLQYKTRLFRPFDRQEQAALLRFFLLDSLPVGYPSVRSHHLNEAITIKQQIPRSKDHNDLCARFRRTVPLEYDYQHRASVARHQQSVHRLDLLLRV